MPISDWIQIAAVLAAVGASGVALFISWKDRKQALKVALHQAQLSRLAVELEYAVRLAANRSRGGSTDPLEVKRLGAEALALTGVVGERWAPHQFNRAVSGKDRATLEAHLQDPDSETPQWVKDKIEAGLAVHRIVDAMYEDLER